ncbi:MAG: YqgE/AlgH family protein [Bacteroidaceae bacterium]|nr:YqgE/AlgH family protein [Bacteroidaceae bacterium]
MEELNYSDLFGITPNRKLVQKNMILVANPLLEDVCFARSVVYLATLEHGDNIMGFVQNKPYPFMLDSVSDTFKDFKNIPVYCGGPVEPDRLFFLHALGNIIPDSQYIGNGISIGGDIVSLLAYLSAGNKIEGYVKFFLGYSGWSVNQLLREIKEESWGVTDLYGDRILYSKENEKMWRNYTLRLGDGYSAWLRVPPMPEFN